MKRKKQLLVNISYYTVITILVLLATYISFTWFLPGFISILVVMALQPLISNIIKLAHLKNRFSLLIVTVIVYILIIGLVLYLCFLGAIQLYLLLDKLPEYIDLVFQFILSNKQFAFLDKYANYFYTSINQVIQNFSVGFIDHLVSYITKIPTLIFNITFVVISSLFFIIDYENIKHFILSHSAREEYIHTVVRCIKETISSVFKAYLIIFIITFLELLLGFYIIRLDDALMLSFSIALFDFFPILGLDMIFIPWILILAFKNQLFLATKLLIVYIIIAGSKNIFEPKLISKHIGLHPLLTIIGMYIGARFFGVMGMIFIPLLMMIGKRIYELK